MSFKRCQRLCTVCAAHKAPPPTTQVEVRGLPTLDTCSCTQPLDPNHHPLGSANDSLIANLDFPAIPHPGESGEIKLPSYSLFCTADGLIAFLSITACINIWYCVHQQLPVTLRKPFPFSPKRERRERQETGGGRRRP